MRTSRFAGGLSLVLAISACGSPEGNDSDFANLELAAENLIADANMTETEAPTVNNLAVEQEPPCADPPASGTVLEGRRSSNRGHVLEIDNGTGRDAIVKLKRAGRRDLVSAFFVARNSTGSLRGIPDGRYVIQYAFGPGLAEDCRSFAAISSAGEFPDEETLQTESRSEEGGTRIYFARLRYTLHPVDHGDVQPEPIDAAAFLSD